MEDIIQYMLRNREERRAHLKLEQECSEIGGSGSIEYKGLLAYHLGTTIPTKMKFKIQLCHASGNGKCSNVNHLYWGTARDNVMDMQGHGTFKSINQKIKEKYGDDAEIFLAKMQKNASMVAVKSKPKEHWEQFRHHFDGVNFSQSGWAYELSPKIGFSATHIRRIAKKLSLL